MFKELRETELEYIRCFSKETKEDSFIKFRDENLEYIYASNITIIRDEIPKKKVPEIILNEIKKSKRESKEFLIAEVQGEIKRKDLSLIRMNPSRIDKLDYFYIHIKKCKNININSECKIVQVIEEYDFNNAIKLSLLESTHILGRELAFSKITRKVQVYKDKNNNLITFLCYYNDRAIGSCELLINNNCAKIEDFGILEKYRGRGFGKSLLSFVIDFANNLGAEIAYVITESDNTAKEMYKKFGFKKCGEKTQIIYDLY